MCVCVKCVGWDTLLQPCGEGHSFVLELSVRAFQGFLVANLFGSKSGLHKANRKPRELTTVLFLESRGPQLVCLLLCMFQSPLLFVLNTMSKVYSRPSRRKRDKYIHFLEAEVTRDVV